MPNEGEPIDYAAELTGEGYREVLDMDTLPVQPREEREESSVFRLIQTEVARQEAQGRVAAVLRNNGRVSIYVKDAIQE